VELVRRDEETRQRGVLRLHDRKVAGNAGELFLRGVAFPAELTQLVARQDASQFEVADDDPQLEDFFRMADTRIASIF
jgi:hypothetical protein